jgi:hypothetical protein
MIAKEIAYKHSLSSSGFNSSFSVAEVEQDSCSPREFIGLKNGGPDNDFIVEGIIFQSGRLWNKDQRWSVSGSLPRRLILLGQRPPQAGAAGLAAAVVRLPLQGKAARRLLGR